jgi:hypothetical protein
MNGRRPSWLASITLSASIAVLWVLSASVDGAAATMRYELKVLAAYYQLYLQDDNTEIPEMGPWRTDKETFKRRLAVAPGLIAIDAASYRFVPVVVEVLDNDPPEDFDAWEHVVEAGLHVRSGRLVVYAPTLDFRRAKRIPLPPGPYRMRVSSRGLSTVPPNGLAGDDNYRVQLWRVPSMSGPTVRKQGIVQ